MRQARIPQTRGGWPAELSEAYTTETGGTLNPGRIGRALSPLLKRLQRNPIEVCGYSDPIDVLKLGFGRWMRSDKRRYGPEYLAREPAEFLRRKKL
jgi:hypothetical protein